VHRAERGRLHRNGDHGGHAVQKIAVWGTSTSLVVVDVPQTAISHIQGPALAEPLAGWLTPLLAKIATWCGAPR